MKKITMIGASINWGPKLITDLLAVFDEELEIRFHDINREMSEICKKWGDRANIVYGRNDKYVICDSLDVALYGTDAVLITISTGGLTAMDHDLAIPERYGILATVGDTCGPGGFSRSVRNIPVFMNFAEKFRTIAPQAFIVNYTNPLSSLTGILQTNSKNATVGLCHSYFETLDIIQEMFHLDSWNDISIDLTGMNHFTWVTDFKIKGQDGYRLLEERLQGRSLREVMPKEMSDEIGFISGSELCVELYDAYKMLCYPADRHICEFVPYVIANNPQTSTTIYSDNYEYRTILPYQVRCTRRFHREQYVKRSMEYLNKIFDEQPGQKPVKSRETGADMISAYLYNKPLVDAVNCINIGQAQQLPLGTCVETLGVVDGMGVRALATKQLPERVLELVRPQAYSVKWLIEGFNEQNKQKVLDALHIDPVCKMLKPHEISKMAEELIEANSKYVNIDFLR